MRQRRMIVLEFSPEEVREIAHVTGRLKYAAADGLGGLKLEFDAGEELTREEVVDRALGRQCDGLWGDAPTGPVKYACVLKAGHDGPHR